MTFDELDSRMRVFETARDQCVLPGMFMVARLDGRGFTRLTKEVMDFEAPFDIRFRDAIVETAEHLMSQCGFRFLYGYTESDEISLLFSPGENSFGRKLRKLISILAGEATGPPASRALPHISPPNSRRRGSILAATPAATCKRSTSSVGMMCSEMVAIRARSRERWIACMLDSTILPKWQELPGSE